MSIRSTSAEPQLEASCESATPAAEPPSDQEPEIEFRLFRAIDEAHLLLRYAARRGLDVPDSLTKSLVSAHELARRGRVDSTAEVDFWCAYKALAKLVTPVTVESLEATVGLGVVEPSGSSAWARWRSRPLALNAVTRYSGYCFVFLILVIYGQLSLSLIDHSMTEMRTLSEKLSNSVDGGQMLGPPAPLALADARPIPKESERKQIVLQLGADTEVLRTALGPWQWLMDNVFWLRWLAGGEADAQHDVATSSAGDCKQMTIDAMARLAARRMGNASKSDEAEALLLRAGFVRDGLQQFGLPIIYGWLGALAFVLRTLAKQIEDATFTRQSVIRFRLRIVLGVLAGLGIGWLTTTAEGKPTSGAISRLALAFICGYSVEVFFSAMDRLISAFSTTSAPVK